MVLSSTIIIVSKMIEYVQEMPQSQTAWPIHGTVRMGNKIGVIKALTIQYICIIQVHFPFNVNKLCSDKTKICLDISPAY